jgi:hypothetical protein
VTFSNVRSTWVSAKILENDPDPCCVLDKSLRFEYCNPAWDAFGLQNGGDGSSAGERLVQRSFNDFLPAVVRSFYEWHLSGVLTGSGSWHHRYYCSSAEERRVCLLECLALSDASELLVTHELLTVTPHRDRAVEPAAVHFRDNGTVTMCAHCRKVARIDNDAWDWVPRFLCSRPRLCIAALCPDCGRYYEMGHWGWAD